jgi:hypothetical protein
MGRIVGGRGARSTGSRRRISGALRWAVFVVLGVLVAAAIGVAGPASAASGEGVRRLVLVTGDVAVHVPQTVRAGRMTVVLINRGRDVHIGSLVRLSGGRTLADFRHLLLSPNPPSVRPPWVHSVAFSSFSPLSPGHRVGIVGDLEHPGTYVYFCLLTAPSGRPHALDGELTSFRVVGPETDMASPHPDAEIVATDAGFRTPVLIAGQHLLRMVNHGRQHHEFAIVRLMPGVTPGQVDGWLQGGQAGPAPATFYGGAQDVDPGRSVVLSIRLRAGRYLVVDGETGKLAHLLVRCRPAEDVGATDGGRDGGC